MEWYTEYLNQTTQQQNHLLATKWGQGTPWNSKTPVRYGGDHCYTGCTNVAVAQVLYYLHGEIGIPTASPKNGITYKYLSSPADSIVMSMNFAMFDSPTSDTWALMPLESSSSSGNPDYVATLMLRLGCKLHSTYKQESTSTYSSSIPTVLQNDYGISCQRSIINHLINYSLNGASQQAGPSYTIHNEVYSRQMPVIAGVRRGTVGNHHYHSIVIDGSKYTYYIKRTHYVKRATGETMYVDETVRTMSVCINWGWDGLYQNSSSGAPIWYSVSSLWAAGDYEYNYLTDIIYGFDSI